MPKRVDAACCCFSVLPLLHHYLAEIPHCVACCKYSEIVEIASDDEEQTTVGLNVSILGQPHAS